MNNQIRELSSNVKALADLITSCNSNKEPITPMNREQNTHVQVELMIEEK